jgi:hypothetical protein
MRLAPIALVILFSSFAFVTAMRKAGTASNKPIRSLEVKELAKKLFDEKNAEAKPAISDR